MGSNLRRYSPDGGPIPNNVRASMPMSANDSQKSQFGVKRGYVQKAVFADDDDNITGQLEYKVVIGGQLYPGVLDMSSAGSIFNNHTRVRRGVGRDFTSPDGLAQNTFEDKKDGEAVWCLFINGDGDVPIILKSAVHPRVSENSNYKEPSAADAEFERYEQNGFEFLLANDGTFTVKMVGLADPTTGVPTNPDAVGTVATFAPDGGFTFKNTTGTTFNVDNAADSIDLKTAYGDEIKISAADGIAATTPAGGGTSLTMKSGAVTVTAAKDIAVSSSGGKVTLTGATEVDVADTAGGKLKIADGKVGLGNAAGEVLDILNQLVTALSTCTAAGFGAPISIVAQMTPLLTKLGLMMGGI